MAVYLDDILVASRAKANLKNFEEVGEYQFAFEAQSVLFPRFWFGKDVVLFCDTWPYGVETDLTQREDGFEQLIIYV